jgi:hypothetical protein
MRHQEGGAATPVAGDAKAGRRCCNLVSAELQRPAAPAATSCRRSCKGRPPLLQSPVAGAAKVGRRCCNLPSPELQRSGDGASGGCGRWSDERCAALLLGAGGGHCRVRPWLDGARRQLELGASSDGLQGYERCAALLLGAGGGAARSCKNILAGGGRS